MDGPSGELDQLGRTTVQQLIAKVFPLVWQWIALPILLPQCEKLLWMMLLLFFQCLYANHIFRP
jgi:hypothetical protein